MFAFARITLLSLLLAWIALPAAQAQDANPVRLLELHGPRTLVEGEVANYRARASQGSTRPIGFLWDFGDGIASEGSLVAHRYDAPGTYTVEVVAYNVAGRDTMKTQVTVSARPEVTATPTVRDVAPRPRAAPEATAEAPPAPAPRISRKRVREALFSHTAILPATDGYTWILASDLWKERLNRQMLRYRLQGLRVEIMTDTTGTGSPVHRIIAGHFPTVGQALLARSMMKMPNIRPQLYAFAEDGIQIAASGLPAAMRRLDPDDRAWLEALHGPTVDPALADRTAPPALADADPDIRDVPPADDLPAPLTAAGRSLPDQPAAAAAPNPGATAPGATATGATRSPGAVTSAPMDIGVWMWFLGGVLSAILVTLAALVGYSVLSTSPPPPSTVKKARPPIGLRIGRRLHPLPA